VGIAMPQERDPFPFPRNENDETYTGTKAIQVKYELQTLKLAP